MFHDNTKLTDIKNAKKLKDLQLSIMERLASEKFKLSKSKKLIFSKSSLLATVEALKKECLPYRNIKALEKLRDDVNLSMARYEEFFKSYQSNPGIYIYFNIISHHLECAICSNDISIIYVLVPCGHKNLCLPCINLVMASDKKCPSDRQ